MLHCAVENNTRCLFSPAWIEKTSPTYIKRLVTESTDNGRILAQVAATKGANRKHQKAAPTLINRLWLTKMYKGRENNLGLLPVIQSLSLTCWCTSKVLQARKKTPVFQIKDTKC